MIGTVVIKAIRACNLRCPYCYYINAETEAYGSIIDEETLRSLYARTAEYLKPGQAFTYVWHGGEPLMLGRGRFQRFLDLQQEDLQGAQVQNVVQTNGVLLDIRWIEFFRRNDIDVGISIDGTRTAHDKNRVNIAGRGTYDQVVEAIRLCIANDMPVGTLSVIDGNFNGSDAVRRIEQLGVAACDFLIPMTNNALQARNASEPYAEYTDFAKIGRFLADAFQRWTEQSEPVLTVRLFECVIRNAFGFESGYLDAGSANIADFLVLETDGELCLDPDFWHIDRFGLGRKYAIGCNIQDATTSLRAVEENIDRFAQQHGLAKLPDDCQNCKVRSLCRGAHPASRYGLDSSFNHRSAYCQAMFMLCEAVLDYIVQHDYTKYLYDEDLKRHLRKKASAVGPPATDLQVQPTRKGEVW